MSDGGKTDIFDPKTLPKLTAKQMGFVQKVAEGKDYSTAWRETYDTKGHDVTVWANASRLANHSKVTAWLRGLEQAQLTGLIVTKETQTKELEEAKGKALQANQVSAAVKAIELKGRLHGLYAETRETIHKYDASKAFISAMRELNRKPLKTKQSKIIDITPDTTKDT